MSEPIPELKRKFDLLIEFGPRKTMEKLAEAFGRQKGTLEWWANGDGGRKRGLVPRRHLATLLEVFADALPSSLSREHVRTLVFGPAADLERAFKSRSGISLEDLIQSEGKMNTMLIKRASDLSLVEADNDRSDLAVVTLGERFQLVVQTSRAGHVLLLQHAQQAWGIVAFAEGGAARRHLAGRVVVPGARGARSVYIREETATGIHRFIAFVCPRPYPVPVMDAAHLGITLDQSRLLDLAEHVAASPKHLREIHVLTVHVARP